MALSNQQSALSSQPRRQWILTDLSRKYAESAKGRCELELLILQAQEKEGQTSEDVGSSLIY
jgi:hypothetical protein